MKLVLQNLVLFFIYETKILCKYFPSIQKVSLDTESGIALVMLKEQRSSRKCSGYRKRLFLHWLFLRRDTRKYIIQNPQLDCLRGGWAKEKAILCATSDNIKTFKGQWLRINPIGGFV